MFEFPRDAACRRVDPAVFCPVETEDGHVRPEDLARARAHCDVCPVRARCLKFALDQGTTAAIYGGLSPAGRRELRAGRRLREDVPA